MDAPPPRSFLGVSVDLLSVFRVTTVVVPRLYSIDSGSTVAVLTLCAMCRLRCRLYNAYVVRYVALQLNLDQRFATPHNTTTPRVFSLYFLNPVPYTSNGFPVGMPKVS